MNAEPASARHRFVALASWSFLILVAAALAGVAAVNWIAALVAARPVLYGEGAVANAALLLREGSDLVVAVGTEPYHEVGDRFVAANYPPLYFAIASLGDPFVVGRAVSIASVLAVTVVIAWRARSAGAVVSAALGITFLATAPVAIWGAAVKPDPLALALTVGAVALLDRHGPRYAIAAGALLAAAAWAKPTALLAAIALAGWLLATDRGALARCAMGAVVVAAVAIAHAATLGLGEVWRHVVTFNTLPWHPDQTLLLLLLGAVTFGISVGVAVLAGAFRGAALAYVIGAVAIALLGGREGATINYLLDLVAATSFALATVAPRLRPSPAYPLAAMVQLSIATLVLAPFGLIPGREPATGAWGSSQRDPVVASLAREGGLLVEDSGLLIAAGARPLIDDLFLWSRLVEARTIDPAPLLARVRVGGFVAIVSEADLERLDAAPAYARARWHPALVAAILERYRLERATGTLWIYRPR